MRALFFIAILFSATCLAQEEAVVVDGSNATPDAMPSASVDAPATEETPPTAEEDGPAIPVPYDISRYDSTWDKNPFLLKTNPPVQQQVNWGQDWALASMSKYGGKIRISIRNKQTNEIKRIYNEPKEGDEFRLVEANFNRSRKEASAKIAKGAEEAELKYDENMAPVTVNNTMRANGTPNQATPQPGVVTPNGAVGGNRAGIMNASKPIMPNQNGRVFNAPNLQNGTVGQAGFTPAGNAGGTMVNTGAPIQGAVVNPTLPVGTPNTTPPTISRRRQLIPAPVVAPQSNP